MCTCMYNTCTFAVHCIEKETVKLEEDCEENEVESEKEFNDALEEDSEKNDVDSKRNLDTTYMYTCKRVFH